MNVLILEDDPMMRELLGTLVQAQRPEAGLLEADTLDDALALWREHRPGLILCDWVLPGNQSGVTLVKTVRAEDKTVPILMVTGQGDRRSVVNVARLGVNDFIIKPFQVADISRRLGAFLHPREAPAPAAPPPELDGWLKDIDGRLRGLTLMSGARDTLHTLMQPEPPNARDLSRQWQENAAITSRLIQIANSSLMPRYGKTVSHLLDAINAMGVTMALNQVLALSLKEASGFKHPYLAEQAERFDEETQAIAAEAAELSARLDRDIALNYTAGLLHRLGELAVLQLIQQYQDAGGTVGESAVDAALARYAQPYGNAVKTLWLLPLELRERIGATHYLAADAVRQDLILMAVAADRAKADTDSETHRRRLRGLGLNA